MSVHSEVCNMFYNRSGNTPILASTRSGDISTVDEYFGKIPSIQPSSDEILIAKENYKDKKSFLIEYFSLLKKCLNPIEWTFVKEVYNKGYDEKTVSESLGINYKKFIPNLRNKILVHRNEIDLLVSRSSWEDAKLFATCFLSSPGQIQSDDKLMQLQPRSVKGWGNLIEAQSRREKYLQRESDRLYERNVYMKGYNRGYKKGYSEGKEEGQKYVLQDSPDFIEFRDITLGIIGKTFENSMVSLNIPIDTKEVKTFIRHIDNFFRHYRQLMRNVFHLDFLNCCHW